MFMRFFATALAALSVSGALAQSPATRPLQIVVPFAPGGFVDAVGRMLSEGLSKSLGQPVVVINQPGANGTVAANNVSRASADGNTVLLASVSILAISPHLYKTITYDPLTDFEPIGQIVTTSNTIVVNPSSGIRSMKDLVDRARARQNTVSYGSTGAGSIQHLVGEMVQQQGNVQLLHVPYKGVAPAVVDLLGGTLTFMYADATSLPMIRAGTLLALAASPQKIEEFPNLLPISQALAQAGVPNFVAPGIWYGLLAPKGTTPEIVAKLNAALTETLRRPDVRQKLIAAGAIPTEGGTSAAFASMIRADHDRYKTLIKAFNITVQE